MVNLISMMRFKTCKICHALVFLRKEPRKDVNIMNGKLMLLEQMTKVKCNSLRNRFKECVKKKK